MPKYEGFEQVSECTFVLREYVKLEGLGYPGMTTTIDDIFFVDG